MAERYVRVCARHGADLVVVGDSLKCPKGHEATEWDTWDRERGKIVDSTDREGKPMQQRTVKPPPIGAGVQRAAQEQAAAKEQAAAREKAETLESKKFVDGSGLTLFLLLRREPRKNGGDPFRIRWRLEGSTKKGEPTAGVHATAATETAARHAYAAAVGNMPGGWKEVAIVFGSRKLELRPIPAARKSAP